MTTMWRGMGFGFVGLVLITAACTAPGGGGGTGDVNGEVGSPDETSQGEVGGETETPGDIASGETATADDVVAPETSGPDTTAAETVSDVTQAEADVGPDLPPAAGAPQILSLSADTSRITVGDDVVFNAIVTDPDGVDDLVGGTLRDPTTGATYGAFATTANEGAYRLRLVWADIHATAPIGFEAEITRLFHADFFDQAGNKTTGEVRVSLYCISGGPACLGECDKTFCGGECMLAHKLRTDPNNCGGCGVQCGEGERCQEAKCICDFGFSACGEQCKALRTDPDNCGACGLACDSGACELSQCLCGSGVGCSNGQSCLGDDQSFSESRCYEAGAPRLVGGTAKKGQVELSLGDEWRPVCNTDSEAALVVCRELFGPSAHAIRSSVSTTGRDAIQLTCDGSELRLGSCSGYLRDGCLTELVVECTDACVPQCAGLACGDNGCGGSCGACAGDCIEGACIVTYLEVSGNVALQQFARYTVPVTAGKDVRFELSAPKDVDLYLRLNAAPTLELYSALSDSASGHENLVVTPTVSGTMHIGVYGYEATSFDLTVIDP